MELETWRCPACRKILARVSLAAGSVVEVKCRYCATVSTLDLTGQFAAVRSEKVLASTTKLC